MASEVSCFFFPSAEMKRNQRYSSVSLSVWCVTNVPGPTEAPVLLPCGRLRVGSWEGRTGEEITVGILA